MTAYSGLEERSWRELILLCTFATIGDVVSTLVIYGICSVAARWLNLRSSWNICIIAALLGAISAVIIERVALASGQWTYARQMPLVPVLGVGLWPFLQLTLLVPTALLIATRWSSASSAKGNLSLDNTNQYRRRVLIIIVALIAAQLQQGTRIVAAQMIAPVSMSHNETLEEKSSSPDQDISLARYVDQAGGLTADEAVAYALEHNGELLAARKEIEAAQGLIRQAGLKPNPTLSIQRQQQINGSDNDTMIGGSLPLELGGRRAARVAVAQRELEMSEQLLANRERTLIAEVRAKFGEALSAVLKLGFTEDLLNTTRRGYKLVMARVIEGRTAPLEQNMVLVEVNRIRSMRETNEGKVEIALLELRNLIGMEPEAVLRLRGSFDDLLDNLPPLSEAITGALQTRPDLLAARAAENLAQAQIEQARAGGRLDAELTGQYGRNNFSFPQRGVSDAGRLVPIQGIFHSVTVGITLDLPVRNKNQGAIEAAVAQSEAAKRRREFAELTVRREVTAAYARYERAARAMEIFKNGVQGQASANLNVVRQTYELGAKTLLDYISEQRRYIEVETSYIDALLDTYQARVEIERAAAAVELIKR